MKYSLRLGPPGPISRDKAWVCFSMNLVVPGTGSLLARKRSGYLQFLLGAAGLTITTICGAKFIAWYLANISRLQEGAGDPLQNLQDMWMAARWPLLGIILFGLGWVWSMITTIILVSKAPKGSPAPPVIK